MRLFTHFAFGVSIKCLWSRLRRIMKYLIVTNNYENNQHNATM